MTTAAPDLVGQLRNGHLLDIEALHFAVRLGDAAKQWLEEGGCPEENLFGAIYDGVEAHGAAALGLLSDVASVAGGCEGSWLLTPGEGATYALFCFLDYAAGRDDVWRVHGCALAMQAVLSESPLVPFDFRLLAAEWFLANSKAYEATAAAPGLVDATTEAPAPRVRSTDERLMESGDSIDHTYPIPDEVAERAKIVQGAARTGAEIARSLAASRLLCALSERGLLEKRVREAASPFERSLLHLHASALVSSEYRSLIEEDAGSRFADWRDYLVSWDQLLYDSEGYSYTLSEVLRIALLAPEFAMPDVNHRRVLLGLHRSALRLSGGAIMGLRAGLFYVEHGLSAPSSVVYFGRGAVVGKGVVFDATGGVVLLSRSFIGGGFLPVLIHTHKHVRTAEGGISERRRIIPAAFLARKGARFPMGRIGLHECADFLEAPTGIEGIESLRVTHADGLPPSST